jgi:hypothetical protein
VRGLPAIAVVMAGTLLVGCSGGTDSSRRSGGSSASSTTTAADLGSTGAVVTANSRSLDPCLVGHWLETGEIDRVTLEGAQLVVEGGSGVTLTFMSGGRETAAYSGSQPLSGTLNGVLYEITKTGSVQYDVSASGTSLTFANPHYDNYKQTATVAGRPITLAAPSTPAPDFYQCAGASLRQNQNGYAATYQRQ